jgi:hypothetical protein
MRNLAFLVTGASIVVACGGGEFSASEGGVDGSTHEGATGHAGSSGHGGSGGSGGSPADSGGDAPGADSGGSSDGGAGTDAASCTPPDEPCTTPCPKGTYCLKVSGPLEMDLGCTPIPPSCSGTASCSCMAPCFCTGTIDKCVEGSDYLECDNGAVSRREFKRDISYLTSEERAELASEALSTSLARYHYKGEPDGQKKHLGFIIDDKPASSPAIASDQTHVDEYGYTSMLLAAVQEQQRQIDELKRELAETRVCRER